MIPNKKTVFYTINLFDYQVKNLVFCHHDRDNTLVKYSNLVHLLTWLIFSRLPRMPVNGNPAPQEQLLIDVADYAPVLPDAVTQQLLSRAGLDTEADPRIARISALAAQKVDFVKSPTHINELLQFISDILLDAFQCAKNRQNKERTISSKHKDVRKNVLTMDDLQQATQKVGITLKKPPYFH